MGRRRPGAVARVGCGEENQAVPGSLQELGLVAGQRAGLSPKPETERRGTDASGWSPVIGAARGAIWEILSL